MLPERLNLTNAHQLTCEELSRVASKQFCARMFQKCGREKTLVKLIRNTVDLLVSVIWMLMFGQICVQLKVPCLRKAHAVEQTKKVRGTGICHDSL